jgi:glycosyltransferase involved in cell wall biosynthesis
MKISDHIFVDLPARVAGETDKVAGAQPNECRMAGKKVAIFIQSLAIGGAERATLNLVKGLISQEIQVDLLLANRSGEFLSLVPPQVNVVDLRGKRVLLSLFPLVQYLRSQHPDILHSVLPHASLIAIWAVQLARVHTPLIISQHNTMSKSLAGAPFIRNKVIRELARWFFHYADAAICVSQGVAEDFFEITAMPRQKTHVVNNPLIFPGFDQEAYKPISHPWFTFDAPPVILAVGRLTTQKDYPTLLRAFSIVCQKRAAHLLILGDGKERANLVTLVSQLNLTEKVQMPGLLQNPLAYMAQARLLVLSSRWEGFGNVLVEAMACGTPVVSTDCNSGPREILENGRFGRLVPVGDPESLASAILETLETTPDRSLLKLRAQDFTIDKSVRKYIRVFETCLLSHE